MASVLTWENCINDGTSYFIKQYKDLIGGALPKSQVKEIVKKTELILDKIKNLDHFSRFLSTYELDQISMILEDIIFLGKDFRGWSKKKPNRKENKLERLSKAPVLVSFFLFLNKKNWQSFFFETSTLQLSQTPQLEFHYNEWGQEPYFWIRTDLGVVKKISKQFLGASDISIYSYFEGTLAETIKIESNENGHLLAYTFLRVCIDHSNNCTRLIRLNICNDLAIMWIGHLYVNDRVAVYGHLENYTDVDENGMYHVSYKLTVNTMERRDSNHERDDELAQYAEAPQLWMETDGTIQSLSKSNLGALNSWLFAKFDEGIVTQPVSYENRGNDILCARTYLRVPRSNGVNRLIILEAWNEKDRAHMKDLNTHDRVSVLCYLLSHTDVDQNGKAHYKFMPQQLSFLNY